MDGSFREHSARGSEDHGRHDVIFRPARAWHADAFSKEGARCFNIEIAEGLVANVDACRVGDQRTIARLMRQTRRELRHSADAPLVIEGLLYQIIGEAFQRPVDGSPRWIDEVERIVRTRFRETLPFEPSRKTSASIRFMSRAPFATLGDSPSPIAFALCASPLRSC